MRARVLTPKLFLFYSMQTLRLVRAAAGDPTGRERDSAVEELYFAVDGREMVRAVGACASPHSVHAAVTEMMVVGHAPGCEELVEYLAQDRVAMPPGTAVVLEERADWEGLDERVGWELGEELGSYRVVEVLNPKKLLQE